MRTYLLIAALLVWPMAAEARHIHFAGPHPIAAKYGGGYCYIETPHLHAYAPDHAGLYQQVGDEYVFTGDPTPFGYDGDKFKYYGNHPVAMVDGQYVYCYIDGPHFHSVPPPDDGYKTKSGVAFYVGPYTPEYKKWKPQRARVVNAEYRPYVQFRPVVEVQPPSEWQGEVYVAPPAVEVAAPGVTVAAPGVYVNAPAPPVILAPPPPHVVVTAPVPHVVVGVPPPVLVAPPAPHVVIGAPPPVVVGGPRVVVGAPAPGVVVVKGHHEEHWEHHDNGKHKGWYK